MSYLAVLITTEHIGDLVLFVIFMFGVFLYFLNRSGDALRKGQITRRRDYFYQNFDVMLIRTALICLPVYWIWRHYTVAGLLMKFGVGSIFGADTVGEYYSSPFAGPAIGYAANSLVTWILKSPKVPQFFKDWLHAEIPDLPPAGK